MWKIVHPSICKETAEVIQDMMNDFYPTERTIKVNWGNSKLNRHEHAHVWGNKLESVHRSGYKRLFFELCKDLGTVPVCTSYEGPCFQHRVPNGSNGLGVVYVDREEDFMPDFFSTKEIVGKEFRVYFCYDIPYQYYQKMPTGEPTSTHLQTSGNGWGYGSARPEFARVTGLKDILRELTTSVKNRLELSYGAVDFKVSEDHTVYILESNSAPTLFNVSLLNAFCSQFKEKLG